MCVCVCVYVCVSVCGLRTCVYVLVLCVRKTAAASICQANVLGAREIVLHAK